MGSLVFHLNLAGVTLFDLEAQVTGKAFSEVVVKLKRRGTSFLLRDRT